LTPGADWVIVDDERSRGARPFDLPCTVPRPAVPGGQLADVREAARREPGRHRRISRCHRSVSPNRAAPSHVNGLAISEAEHAAPALKATRAIGGVRSLPRRPPSTGLVCLDDGLSGGPPARLLLPPNLAMSTPTHGAVAEASVLATVCPGARAPILFRPHSV